MRRCGVSLAHPRSVLLYERSFHRVPRPSEGAREAPTGRSAADPAHFNVVEEDLIGEGFGGIGIFPAGYFPSRVLLHHHELRPAVALLSQKRKSLLLRHLLSTALGKGRIVLA